MFNCGLEPENRAPYDEKSENINMGTSDFESKLDDIGKRRAEELGLKTDVGVWYAANDIHRLLSEGVEVFDGSSGLSMGVSGWGSVKYDEKEHIVMSSNFVNTRNKALLIGIRPIVQESEERKLLRKWLSYTQGCAGGADTQTSIIKEVKRLLERKGE